MLLLEILFLPVEDALLMLSIVIELPWPMKCEQWCRMPFLVQV